MGLPEDDARITPVEELFTYHIYGIPDAARRHLADPPTYALRVEGGTRGELVLSLEQLQEEFPQVSRDMVLQCMTDVHWGRVHLTGPRLLDVLERAGIEPRAIKVGIHGAEGFDADLAFEEVRANPDAFLLAHAMNGEPLTVEHGYPVRLTADGKYGYKWPKWVERVDVLDYDYQGHYERKRGWSDAGTRGEPVM